MPGKSEAVSQFLSQSDNKEFKGCCSCVAMSVCCTKILKRRGVGGGGGVIRFELRLNFII